MELKDFFEKHRRVAVAFSGGVDSSYLLYAAKKYAEEVRAYYVKSAFQPAFEYEDAVRLAKELEISLCVINLDVLSDETVTSNPSDRCYYCKRKIFSEIIAKVQKDGFEVLLDGTNASDDVADRPGVRALKELKVLSPLKECGLTKKQIRELSKEAGLFTWNKPAYACLATRLPVGKKITKEALEITEKAEAFMAGLGFSDFRVRMLSEEKPVAKLEVRESQLPLLLEKKKEIVMELKKYYSRVLLDLEMRNEQ